MRYIIFTFCFICAASFATPIDVRVLDNKGDPVKDTVVYITATNLPRDEPLESKTLVTEVAQDGRAFKPYVSVARVNQTVLFTNKDDFSHHIYSITGPVELSFIIRAQDHEVKKSFPTEGGVAMGCNIHDWMSGYIKVIDTPYYAITDSSGMGQIHVPVGLENADIIAWHPQMNESVEQKLDQQTTVTFELQNDMSPIPKQKSTQAISFYGLSK